MPSPSDHVHSLLELLRPATPDLARRWLSALLLVPEAEREAVVSSIERRIVELYTQDARSGQAASQPANPPASAPNDEQDPDDPPPSPGPSGRRVEVVQPPQQRDGYVEQVITTYEVVEEPLKPAAQQPKRKRARG